MPRHLGAVGVPVLPLLSGLLALLGLLVAGCSDDEGDRAKVDAVEQQALDAVDGVLHDIAERTGMEFEAGTRSAAICGESYAPRGVRIRVFARLGAPAELSDDAALAVAQEVLVADGWQVEPTGRERLVRTTRDELEMRLDFTSGLQADITAGCIETSNDVAREVADRPARDVAWD